jgi:hypothetical protein
MGCFEHVSTSKYFRFKSPAICAFSYTAIDENFHCMNAISRTLTLVAGSFWQHKVVHSADAKLWISQANRNAGAQKRSHNARLLAHPKTTHVDDMEVSAF